MLNKEELHKFYLNARFLVLSSKWYEGFPMVFPEAMAFKLPLIAPDMAGFPEIVTPQNGLLFQPDNAQSLSEAITKLWGNKELLEKFSENSFSIVEKRFSKFTYFQKLNGIYKKLIA